MAVFASRIIRAAKLEVSLYEEVEADQGAFGQAMLVVVLSSVAAGLGNIQRVTFGAVFLGILVALVGWYVWAFITYFVGAKLLPESSTKVSHNELLRTIGFSSSPGIIRVLGLVPGLGRAVFFIASVWMLVAMVVAVRQALDYTSTWRAVAVCAIGWIIQLVILMILAAIFVGTAGRI